MLLGHQVSFPVAEVKKYHIVLVINLSNSILKPAFVLILLVIFKWSERKKNPFKYSILICSVNVIYDGRIH